MKPAIQFVIRQSGWLAFLLFLFAVANGVYVCEGLRQGSGLHGYTIQHRRYDAAYLVSTWAAFVQMLVSAGMAALFSYIALWSKRGSPRVETRG